jgi:hypothetical protein
LNELLGGRNPPNAANQEHCHHASANGKNEVGNKERIAESFPQFANRAFGTPYRQGCRPEEVPQKLLERRLEQFGRLVEGPCRGDGHSNGHGRNGENVCNGKVTIHAA